VCWPGLLLLAVLSQAVRTPAAVVSPVSARATPAKTEVTIGEPFAIELKAVGPPGTTFSFPADAATDSFELRPEPTPAAQKDAPVAEPGVRRYVASVFALGDAELPAIPVRYRLPDGTEGETATAAVALKVRSLLPKDPAERKLADIRGPIAVSIGRVFWIVLALVAAFAAALALWLLRRRRRVVVPAVAALPESPPDVEALRALDALAASDLVARGEYRAFYIQLTVVAKRYLERRLRNPVLEMTSAETIAFLRGHPHGGELVSTVRDLADAADRIKFARGDGLHGEASRHLAAARSLVSSLEARLRPAPVEGRAA
jgi:hypothetical protein